MRLKESLGAWDSPDFVKFFKSEVESLSVDELPLQQQLRLGNVALDDGFELMVLRRWEEGGRLYVKAGLFFRGIVSGSCCIDDPTPVEAHEEYCELVFDIDRETGETKIRSSG